MMRALLLAGMLSFACGLAMADDVVMVGDPKACHVKVEFESKEQMLHLRPAIPMGAKCDITELMVQTALYQALDRLRGKGDLRLIFLGRLADYPWLSHVITNYAWDNSGALGFWDLKTGHAVDGDDNGYVVDALTAAFGRSVVGHPYLPSFGDVLAEHGYRIAGASAEKVLTKPMTRKAWPTFENLNEPDRKGVLPFDALLHLRLEKTP